MSKISKDRFRPGLISLLLLLAPSLAGADSVETVYRHYAALLTDFVVEHDLPGDGLITSFDYRSALSRDDIGERLDHQRRKLAEFDPESLTSRESAIAFWLNAYNFFMIAHILENPDNGELISSVRDYGSLFNPYRVFKRDLFDIGGRKHSLSEIEIDILLGQDFKEKGWKDARVHFAVNCASVGCPPLRRALYTGSNVEQLLAENTRRALNTPLHLRIDGDALYLTSLFDWYEADFVDAAGSVWKFWTYGFVMVTHAISTLSSWKQYLDPFNNMLFLAAIPMLAACIALFLLRKEDRMLTLGQ